MNIAKNAVVSMHYKLTNAQGEDLDASEEGEPLVYLHGHGGLVDGLEQALEGKQAGDHVDVRVPPELGYGLYDRALDMEVPLKAFPDDARDRLKEGARFASDQPGKPGTEIVYTVVERHPEHLVVTGNHPLAGQTLVFAVDIVGVRAATKQELKHGHVHGEHGHDH